MSSNIDAKLTKFESNSDLSEQNINFFGNRNDLGGLNLKKHPNNKGKKIKIVFLVKVQTRTMKMKLTKMKILMIIYMIMKLNKKIFLMKKIKIVIFPEIL